MRTPESESGVSVILPCTGQQPLRRRSIHSVAAVNWVKLQTSELCDYFLFGKNERKKQLKMPRNRFIDSPRVESYATNEPRQIPDLAPRLTINYYIKQF
jgi:hypothetical protein